MKYRHPQVLSSIFVAMKIALLALLGKAEAGCKTWPWSPTCSSRGSCDEGHCVCEGARTGVACDLPMPPVESTCQMLAPRRNASGRADDVRLDEIGIVMAMGDSMTAGYNVLKGDNVEYRGWSFSSGSEPSANTLATFLKAYNPHLLGASTGERHPSQAPGHYAVPCPEKDYAICGLNAAVDGARVGWLQQQLDWLSKRLDTLAPGTWPDQWKMITIFSGLDDIVFGPSNNATAHPPTDVHVVEQQFDAILESLHMRFPKLLVNILALPENFAANTTVAKQSCRFFKRISEALGIHWTDLNLWHRTILDYNKMLVRLVQRWQKRCSADNCTMAVALRLPLLKTQVSLHELDSFDCFHPNLRLAEAMAIDIWNEMLEGPQSPQVFWQQKLRCLEAEDRFTMPDPAYSLQVTELLV